MEWAKKEEFKILLTVAPEKLDRKGFIQYANLLGHGLVYWTREFQNPRCFNRPVVQDLVGNVKYVLSAAARHYSEQPSKLIDFNENIGVRTGKNHSLLCNAFSKYTASAACRTGLEQLSQSVAGMSARQIEQRFDGHSIRSLINSLSKVVNIDQCPSSRKAMEQLAQFVADMDAGRMREISDGQDIGTVINGLSKVVDADECPSATGALERLSQSVAAMDAGQIREIFDGQHIANVINGLSKVVDADRCPSAIPALGVMARSIAGMSAWQISKVFNGQAIANVINGLSKVVDADLCPSATGALEQLSQSVAGMDADKVREIFDGQQIANVINGLSKVVDADQCRSARGALEAMARSVAAMDAGQIREIFDGQHIGNVINGLSKVVNADQCPSSIPALGAMAQSVAGMSAGQINKFFNGQHIANVINGLSKVVDADQSRSSSSGALEQLSQSIAGMDADKVREIFDGQHIANVINGLSKVVDVDQCPSARGALERLAQSVAGVSTGQISKVFNGQEIANVINGLGKVVDADQCPSSIRALEVMARSVAGMSAGQISKVFNGQHIANVINGLSKVVDADQCPSSRGALEVMAQSVAGMDADKVREIFDGQAIANVINGLSKVVDVDQCPSSRGALEVMAQSVAGMSAGQINKVFNGQEIANVVNGLSKVVEAEQCPSSIPTLEVMAQSVAGMDAEQVREIFDGQHIARVINGLSKVVDGNEHGTSCRQGIIRLMEVVSPSLLKDCTEAGIAQISNALGRLAVRALNTDTADAPATLDCARHGLHLITDALVAHPQKLDNSGALNIALVLVALDRAQMLDETARVAQPCLSRLQRLVESHALRSDTLETLGIICLALRPMLKIATLREMRGPALQLLTGANRPPELHLQAILDRKLNGYLTHVKQNKPSAHAVTVDGEPSGTRFPAYTLYQIVNVYSEALAQLGNRKSFSKAERLQARRRTKLWLENIYSQVEPLITADMSLASWNLIARMDAASHGEPNAILDKLIATRLSKGEVLPFTTFDHKAVFDSMDHEPRMPRPDQGMTEVRYFDFNGKPQLQDDKARIEHRYSIWNRVTGLPIYMVQMPPNGMGTFMAQRIIYVHAPGQAKPIPCRIDVLGGSMMKGEADTIEEVAQRAMEGNRRRKAGYLVAIPLGETQQHTSLTDWMKAEFPSRESYYYGKRLLLSTPPTISGIKLGPMDHVLEGRFKIAVCTDRAPGMRHPYQLGLVRPTDGFGFIRESIARKAGWYDKILNADVAPYGGTVPTANLAPQATQHLPRDESLREEFYATARAAAKQLGSQSKVSVEEIYRVVTSAGAKGYSKIAWPIDGENGAQVVLSECMQSEGETPNDAIVGRAPYDNARSLQQASVADLENDAVKQTRHLLDSCASFQYTFSVMRPRSGSEAEKIFFKGVLVVIKDEDWAWDNTEVVMSANDMKSASSWTDAKKRPTEDEMFDGKGVLMATEIWPKGSGVGIDTRLQASLGGDYDGDAAFVSTTMPQLAQVLGQQNQIRQEEDSKLRQQSTGQAFKAPKTHHPAINENDGTYQYGRSDLILAALKPLLGRASKMQFRFLSLSKNDQERVSRNAMRAVYEGLPTAAVDLLKALLREDDGDIHKVTEGHTVAWKEQKVEELDQLHAMLAAYAAQATGDLRDATRELLTLLPQWAHHAGVPWRAPDGDEDIIMEQPDQDRLDAIEADMDLLLDTLPRQLLEREGSQSYVAGNPATTISRLITEIIKRGTDAFKAPYGLDSYEAALYVLGKEMNALELPARPPYTKALAGEIAQGRVNTAYINHRLENNPTLAGMITKIGATVAETTGLLAMVARQEQTKQEQRLASAQVRQPGEREMPSGQWQDKATQASTRQGQVETPEKGGTEKRKRSGMTAAEPLLLERELEAWMEKVTLHEPAITAEMTVIGKHAQGTLQDLDTKLKTADELKAKWQARRGPSTRQLGIRDKKDALRYTVS